MNEGTYCEDVDAAAFFNAPGLLLFSKESDVSLYESGSSVCDLYFWPRDL